MNTNKSQPQWRKITPDCQPQFPCWLWTTIGKPHMRFATALRTDQDTHWHPDSPNAPEGGPFVPAPHGLSIAEAASGRSFGKPPPTSPAATATPDTDAAIKINSVHMEDGRLWLTDTFADFARRLERERDEAREGCEQAEYFKEEGDKAFNALRRDRDGLAAQLKDMTDQFFAVSGQLGGAREKINASNADADKWCKIANGRYTELARFRSENRALAELLRRGARMVVQFGSSIEQEPQAEAFSAEVEKHLAQHDSPGAGVKGENLP